MQCALDNEMWVEVVRLFGADASITFMLLYYFSPLSHHMTYMLGMVAAPSTLVLK